MKALRIALTALMLVFGLALLGGAVPIARAGTLIVDNTIACDDVSGSPAYCTIQAAINAASNGDTISVAAGTYNEYLVIQKSIHLIGEDKDTTILTYTGTPTVEQLIMLGWNTGGTLAGGATVQGFKLLADVGLDGDRDLIKLRANGASGSPIVIKDNIFQGDGSTRYLGIETAYDAGHVIVENNEFYDLAYGAWFNVLINAEIKGNTITDAIFTALALCTSDLDQIHDVNIVDNTILRSSTYPAPPPSWGPWLSGMHIGSTVYNMTITGNTIADGNYHSIVIHDRGATSLSNVHINCNNMDNNPDGFLNEVDVAVDAEYNWWGDANGPTHASNPGGMGDAVSDGVDFDPWMAVPVDGVCPPPADDEGPITSNVVATPNPSPVNTATVLTANVDDSTTGGSNIASAEYNTDGGSFVAMSAQDGGFDEVSEDVEATVPAFAAAGIHEVCVRGKDAADNTGPEECILLVVYDPEGGFVTGGGWIWSVPGAYTADPELEGKATFGFVSKYKKGAQTPEGQTEFVFKMADLNFHSSSYDWLVVAGAKAKFKGTGTINGEGEYKFMLTALDADLKENDGFDVDRFRIKIWYEVNDIEHVVYDNGLGGDEDDDNATTEIGGGSIVIHTKKK